MIEFCLPFSIFGQLSTLCEFFKHFIFSTMGLWEPIFLVFYCLQASSFSFSYNTPGCSGNCYNKKFQKRFQQGSFLHIVAVGCYTAYFGPFHSHYHHLISQDGSCSKIPRNPILQPQLRKYKMYISFIRISLTAALLIAAFIFSVVARTRGSPTAWNHSIA